MDKNNIPTILEITRRAPGCQYVKLVEYATGINYSELIVKAELGLPMGEIKQLKPQKYIVRHCIMGNNDGTLDNVVIDQSIKFTNQTGKAILQQIFQVINKLNMLNVCIVVWMIFIKN